MSIFDITHTLTNHSAPWPGDTPYQLQPTWRLQAGDSVNLSRVALSPHNGTHADAPYHYDENGLTMDQVPPERYIGPAQVVELSGRAVITAADLQTLSLRGVERLLVRTGSCPDPTRFNQDFTYFAPEAIRYLSSVGVRLLGTDAHSMDAYDSKELPAHHACGESGILILENLKLTDVPLGRYELIALPLKLEGADGSPVRAVLRSID